MYSGIAKGIFWTEKTLNNEKIKLIALGIVSLKVSVS